MQNIHATFILNCNYGVSKWILLGDIYSCYPTIVQPNQRNVVGVSQNHLTGKGNQHVLGLAIENQQVDFLPKDINLFFSNLIGIYIFKCPIKFIDMDDLKPFPKLKRFSISGGQLKTINGDVLMHLTALQFVEFQDNQITNIGPGLLHHSSNLAHADFNNNLCISKGAVSTTEVANIARELAFKCPPTVEMTEEIILSGKSFSKAVNSQIDPKITAIDVRVKKNEDDIKTLSNDLTSISRKIQPLEEAMENMTWNQKQLDQEIKVLSTNHAGVEEQVRLLTKESEEAKERMAVTDIRINQYEELLNNKHAALTERMQELEEENQTYKERIEALEKFIFNMCAIHAVCF